MADGGVPYYTIPCQEPFDVIGLPEKESTTMGTTEAKVVDATDQGGVTTEVRDRVMLIGIDRPRKRNALTPKIISGLSEAYARFDKDDDLRCALLFGHGPVFCAGYDLTLLKDAVADGMAYGGDAYDPFGLTGRRLSKPLVVAIHGACLAGGLEVALNGDVIVAAERTLFGQPEVTRGLFAFGGGAIRWLQRTSWGNAQVHLLTGDSITAEEAYRIGLVQEIVAPEAVVDRGFAIASAIADAAPLGVRYSLAVSRAAIHEGPLAAAEKLAELRARIVKTEDAAEGVRSFLEKRKGNYVGR
jgi:enoyl-CoA hydratase/carnithine racemase